MELAKCAKCKTVFQRIREPICEKCIKEEEQIFENVKEFLRENPKSTVTAISEATGASARKILGYLRDGRIEVVEGAGLNCGHCGEPIPTGQLCKDCFEKADAKISGIIKDNTPEKMAVQSQRAGVAMHTAARRK